MDFENVFFDKCPKNITYWNEKLALQNHWIFIRVKTKEMSISILNWRFHRISEKKCFSKATISRKRGTVWSLIVCHMGCCYVVVLGKKMSFPWGLDSECGALLTPLSSPLHNVFKWKSNPRIQIWTYLIVLSQIVFGNPENIFSFCTFCTALAKEFENFQIVGILEPKALWPMKE